MSHELAPPLCELHFAGSQILLSAPFRSRPDKPNAPGPPPDRMDAILDLSIPVTDCLAAYHLLRARGAELSFSPVRGKRKDLGLLA